MTTTQQNYKSKKNANERLEELEKLIPNILEAVGKQLDERKKNGDLLEELVNAIISEIGVEKISKQLIIAREAGITERTAEVRKETERMKADGVLVPAETVSAESVIVLNEFRPDGTEIVPGWFRVHMQELIKTLSDELLGKGVGYTGKFDNGNTFTVLEIYNVNAPKAIQSASAVQEQV